MHAVEVKLCLHTVFVLQKSVSKFANDFTEHRYRKEEKGS